LHNELFALPLPTFFFAADPEQLFEDPQSSASVDASDVESERWM
jgi:hypothetical protein